MEKPRRHLIFLIAVVAALGVGVGLVISARRLLDPFNADRFDPASWATADRDGRAAMTRDAIRHLPSGTTEAGIKALLGEPHRIEEGKMSNSDPPGAVRTYAYYLGNWSLVTYDDTFLWVYVDGEGRVISAVIGGG